MVNWTARQNVLYNGQKAPPLLRFHLECGSRVEQSRQSLTEWALEHDPDYLLWLDDDHVFPPELALRLAAHDLPIVGCNYAKKDPGEIISAAGNIRGATYEHIEPKAEGLEAVDLIGFGACLIKAQVFRLLPSPWFEVYVGGEDGYFCKLAREHGLQPYVDHSIKIGHIGEKIYTL